MTQALTKADLKKDLEIMQDEIALITDIDPKALTRIALTAFSKQPELKNCTKQSILASLMEAAEWGIIPDGRMAALIAFGDQCTFIPDYKGKIQLAHNKGNIRLFAGVVKEGDHFEHAEVGPNYEPSLEHTETGGDITWENLVCAYAIAVLPDGVRLHKIAWKEPDIKRAKSASRSAKSGYSPWTTDLKAMCAKTAIHRIWPYLPLEAKYISMGSSHELAELGISENEPNPDAPISVEFSLDDVEAGPSGDRADEAAKDITPKPAKKKAAKKKAAKRKPEPKPQEPELELDAAPKLGAFGATLKLCVDKVWGMTPDDIEIKAGLEQGTIAVLTSTQGILPDAETVELICNAVDANDDDRKTLEKARAEEEAL